MWQGGGCGAAVSIGCARVWLGLVTAYPATAHVALGRAGPHHVVGIYRMSRQRQDLHGPFLSVRRAVSTSCALGSHSGCGLGCVVVLACGSGSRKTPKPVPRVCSWLCVRRQQKHCRARAATTTHERRLATHSTADVLATTHTSPGTSLHTTHLTSCVAVCIVKHVSQTRQGAVDRIVAVKELVTVAPKPTQPLHTPNCAGGRPGTTPTATQALSRRLRCARELTAHAWLGPACTPSFALAAAAITRHNRAHRLDAARRAGARSARRARTTLL